MISFPRETSIYQSHRPSSVLIVIIKFDSNIDNNNKKQHGKDLKIITKLSYNIK